MKTLMAFSTEVSRGRSAFLKDVGTLPTPLKRIIVQGYKGRLSRGHGKPLLGERAPWLLQDMLPLRKRQDLTSMMPGWLSIYAHTLFVDDVLDGSFVDDVSETFLASGLLLQRGLNQLTAALPKRGMIRIQIDQYFLEAASAVLTEIKKHRQKHNRYTKREVDALGKKVSLLKLCATYMLAADGQTDVQAEVLLPVEYLATGAQLFDDIADWREDWRNKTYTPLLQRTFTKLSTMGLDTDLTELTPSEVFLAMVVTGSLEYFVNEGRKYLAEVIGCVHLKPFSQTAGLIRQMSNEQYEFCEAIAQTRKELEVLRSRIPGRWIRELTHQSRPKLRKLERHLSIVAQST